MEVSFTLEPDDLRRVWQWARMPLRKLAVEAITSLFGITILVGLAGHDYLLGAFLALLTSPVMILSWWLRSRRHGQQAVDKALALDVSLAGPRSIRLGGDGIHYQRMTGLEVYPWAQVRGFHRHARYLLVLVEHVGVVPVPLRAFAQRADAELFWTALLAYKMSGGGAAVTFAADETVWPPPPTSATP